MSAAQAERFIFVHIPKTAGTSIRVVLTDLFGPENISPGFTVRPIGADEARQLDRFAVISGHISWTEIAAHFPQRRLFTFLREPIDRCLSVYGFFRQYAPHPLIPLAQIQGHNDAGEAASLACQLPPEEFFACEHPHVRQNVENRMVWQLGYSAAYERRSEITGAEALARATANLRALAFVGFFEQIAHDTPRLLAALGKQGVARLPVTNKTTSPLRASELSSRTRRAIDRLTELDQQLYREARKLVEAAR